MFKMLISVLFSISSAHENIKYASYLLDYQTDRIIGMLEAAFYLNLDSLLIQ